MSIFSRRRPSSTALAIRDAEESPGFSLSVMRFASDLLQRSGIASLAGITMQGNRDTYHALGYKRVLNVKRDFRPRYGRNGIAARIVDAFPQATWRGGTDVVEDDNPDHITPFEKEFEALAKRLDLFPTLQRADILAGLGRYAILLIGAPGDLDTPMPKKVSGDQIVYIHPYAEDDATILRYNSDRNDPNYGMPDLYTIKRNHTAFIGSNVAINVHHSRVIHIVDGLLDDRVFGLPRMERVWNWLDDLEKVTGAGSEAFWLRAHQGYHYDLDKDVQISDADKKIMKDAADEFANGLRRTIATRGTKVTALGSDVANFANQVDSLITLIAGSTGIPKRILVGSERGELASTQDKTTFDERVSDRRAEYAEPRLLRKVVDMLIELEAVPAPAQYEVVWPDVAELDMDAASKVATQWAGLNKLIGGAVVTPEEIRDRVLHLAPLDDATIAEIEDSLAPPPALAPPPGEVPPGEAPPAGGAPVPPKKPAAPVAASARLVAAKRRLRVARGKAQPRKGHALLAAGSRSSTPSQIRIVRRLRA